MALDEKDVVVAFRDRDKEAGEGNREYLKEAKKAYGFYSGKGQWEQEDIDRLRAERRPALTLNLIGKIVDVISGSEITSRFTPKFLPRTMQPEDQSLGDMMSETIRYIREQANAEHEESAAFRDAIITGIGCCEIRQDYDEDKDGIQKIERVPMFEMRWDPSCTKTNLLDARYVIRKKRVHKDDFASLWPEYASLAGVNRVGTGSSGTETTTHQDAYEYGADNVVFAGQKNTVPVSEYEWWDREAYWVSVDPMTGADLEFDTEVQARDYQKMSLQMAAQIPGFQIPPVVKLYRRKFYRAFVSGGQALEFGPSPAKSHFTYKFITCFEEKHEDKTSWYGVVRGSMDPQCWYNKFMSQIIHVISVSPKGALGFETGAFANSEKAKLAWADPTGFIEFNPGGIQKIQKFDAAHIPSGMEALAGMAKTLIPETTGVNMDVLGGQAGDLRRTATSVMQLALRQGMTVLSPPFDAFRLFRKEQARLLQEYVAEYWTPDRLIRLSNNQMGPFDLKAAQQRYDVVVEEVPTSVNQQQETWDSLTQTNKSLEVLMQAGIMTPDIVADIVPGLSSELRTRMKQNYQMQLQQQQSQPAQEGAEAAPAAG